MKLFRKRSRSRRPTHPAGRTLWLAVVLLAVGVLGARADVVLTPDPLELNSLDPTGDVVLEYTGGGSAFVAGYSVELTWDTAMATAVFARPDSGPFAGAVTFFVVNLGEGHVRIDAAIGGADPGFDAGQLGKITFTAAASTVGTADLFLTNLSLRDSANQPVTGVATVDGRLDIDTGVPDLTGVVITNDSLAHTDDFVKDSDALTITATVTDDDPGFGVANLSADLTALGGGAAVAPDSYAAPTAVWAVAAAVCSPADGVLTVTVTALDSGGNTAQLGDTIIADNTPPAAATGVVVLPGHEQIHLAWDDLAAADANPLGIEFRAAAWGDYPAYDTAAPAYPAGPAEGALALQATAGTTADWAMATRDIYYLTGFVYDMVLQYGPAGGGSAGRATSYWLGDVGGDSGPDGVVDVVHDINQLGNTYGLADTDDGFDPYCDVGPTDTGSPRGVPRPNDDHEIGFEDMMVFALNYTVVGPTTKTLDRGTPQLAWSRVDDAVWSLDLVARGGDLQGLNLRAKLPDGVTCAVQPGRLAAAQSAPVFLQNIARHGLDAGLALFGQGAGIEGTGELLRVTLSEPVPELDVTVTARDGDNRSLELQMSPAELPGPPALARLEPNYPNPFNPRTTLAFSLPDERPVTLAVYGLDGTLVRTLLDGPSPAGRREVVWDGCDDLGRPVAAGAYFARIEAGDFREIRKMVLVK